MGNKSGLLNLVSSRLTGLMHDGIVLAILLIAFWSGITETIKIFEAGHPALHDILTLFIYLEVMSMLLVMLRTHHVPVRFLVYIMITALARWVVIDIKVMSIEQILGIAGAILILSVSVLVVKFASVKYPSEEI